jgi:hypothetical protein
MVQIVTEGTKFNDKIIIHAYLYKVEGGSWHSFNQKKKIQWEE